jgi:hypothetical protein
MFQAKTEDLSPKTNRQLAIGNRQSVIFCHCFQRAISQDGPNCVGACFHNLFYSHSIAARERSENKTFCILYRMCRLNADAQPYELAGAGCRYDRLQTIMPAG